MVSETQPGAPQVFISYSHKDKKWLEQLETHLAPLRRKGALTTWSDQQIQAGQEWRKEIGAAILAARAAVLLVSPDFLASDFIAKNELPPLLEAAEKRGLTILWVAVSTSLYDEELFAKYQSVNNPAQPLDLLTPAKRNAEWAQVARRIKEAIKADSPPISQNPATLFNVLPAGARTTGLSHDAIPYVGPMPFLPTQPDLFFGRDEEVSQLVDILTTPTCRVVLLFGASGSGKTSLVNTALTRVLQSLDYSVFPVARVGVQPQLDSTAKPKNLYTFSALCSMQINQTDKESLLSVTWDDYVQSKLEVGKKGAVLIVDQLEEILSPGFGATSHVSGFFAQLHTAIVRNTVLRVILVFREEFLGTLRRLAGELASCCCEFILHELSCSKAAIAIKKPAESLGVIYEENVVEMLVAELSRGKQALYPGMIIDDKTNFVEPLHLQLVCRALWNELPEGLLSIRFENVEPVLYELVGPFSKSESLTREILIATFVSSVLQTFCDRAVELTATSKRAQREGKFPSELIDLGCLHFITEHQTRTPPIRQGLEWTGDLPNWVLEELGHCHMLRVEERHTERVWELSHDAWIQPLLRRGGRIDQSTLRQLYFRIVKEVAQGDITRAERWDETAIHLGCLAFVEGQRDRLLPSQLEALAREGLLRRNTKGHMVEFELSHKDLGPAIAEARLHKDLYARLAALKGLKVYVDHTLQINKGTLTNWFDNYDFLLKTLNWDLTSLTLYESEAEFILRASFATGYELDHWLQQMGHQYPPLTATVLNEAAHFAADHHVRRRAAGKLALLGSPESEDLLVELALGDSHESVRQAAAAGLANSERIDCWNVIAAHYHGSLHKQVLAAVAWAWQIRAQAGRQGQFETWLRDCPRRVKIQAYLEWAKIRFRYTASRMAVLCAFATLSSATMTAVTRMVPGDLIGTLTQAPGAFSYSWFHGMIGGLVSGASIPGSVLIWWYILASPQRWRSKSAQFGAALSGCFGGLLGGLLNTTIMLTSISMETLYRIGWLPSLASPKVEAFTTTRFGFSYIVFGFMLGIGVGFSSLPMLVKSRTHNSADEQAMPARLEDLARLIRHSIRECVGQSTWIAFSMVIAAFLCAILLYPANSCIDRFSSDSIYGRITGEAVSFYLGGLGMITGLYCGLMLLKKGISIQGRDEFAIPGGVGA